MTSLASGPRPATIDPADALRPGRRVLAGWRRIPGVVVATRVVGTGLEYDVVHATPYAIVHAALPDTATHPAASVTPVAPRPAPLATDELAVTVAGRWIATTRGQRKAFDEGPYNECRIPMREAARDMLREIDAARIAAEATLCRYVWNRGDGELLACAFHVEPGSLACGVHQPWIEHMGRWPSAYGRELAVTAVDPLGQHAPAGAHFREAAA